MKEVISTIKSAEMVIHGIGEALVMAERRKSEPNVLTRLVEQKAVGEAFGYYFSESGEVVHKVLTVGLQLEDLTPEKKVIAVAGGEKKAKAIRSYIRGTHATTDLITDEAAARELISG